MTHRLAHLWTPSEIVTVRIPGEWPQFIAIEGWVYTWGYNPAFRQVHRGRHSGVEILDYKLRRRQTCTEAAAELVGDEDYLEVVHAGSGTSERRRSAQPTHGRRARAARR